ncbi:craniofacial development protein 2-like [Limulus polyphemus]|uniref:Craniofacial development protein 2-like n=1 Tax=Limulus polyphemus TaxID=6850 RepID=A0ABM1BQQ9_LIMPO|nr:craniofacial development protein 2-like [Limulus polyphemus]
MTRYKLDILGLAEMRWSGCGRSQSEEVTILWPGHEQQAVNGVGMMISKTADKALVEWKPVDERILTARFVTSQSRLTIVQSYAPTETADEVVKDSFYERLQETVDGVHRYDILMVMGDFNTKMSPERINGMVGPFASSPVTNENGDRFRTFSNVNGLCIGNSFFQHKRIHRWTWRSPDGQIKNEIDYICISKRWV